MALLAAALGAAAQDAFAHRHGGSFRHHGFHGRAIIVAPIVVPRYYAAPYAYAPSYYPRVPAYRPAATGYLYFCPDFRRYYPEIRHCPSGWLAVVPGAGGSPGAPPY